MKYDALIIGAGIYGLYASLKLAKQGRSCHILVIDSETSAFMRASYVNQARLHMGYHYPRSLHTAVKCTQYFHRFIHDYPAAIIQNYTKIYAVSEKFGMCSSENFEKFCHEADIPLRPVNSNKFFIPGTVSSCYETEEYTIDMMLLKKNFLQEIGKYPQITIKYSTHITEAHVSASGEDWGCSLSSGETLVTPFVLNASYASINSVSALFNLEPLPMKFELAEMVLCTPSKPLQGYGLTIMDGPFFSVMPFDQSGTFSMSAVRYTPHDFSTEIFPTFSCQNNLSSCRPSLIGNCSSCPQRPASAWPHMKQLAQKYLHPEFIPELKESILTIKALMQSSSTSDSRPVIITEQKNSPKFISVLGGKINTIYELDEVLKC